jgi:hypothetical protein
MLGKYYLYCFAKEAFESFQTTILLEETSGQQKSSINTPNIDLSEDKTA